MFKRLASIISIDNLSLNSLMNLPIFNVLILIILISDLFWLFSVYSKIFIIWTYLIIMDIIFTLHVKNRIKKRKIRDEEIFDAINNPDKISQEYGKYYVQKDIGRGKIEVVYEKDKYINVITVYWI